MEKQNNNEPRFYIGEVIEVISEEHTKEFHLIRAKIPGVIDSIRAYPKAGEIDEPRVGDQVLLLCLDPTWFSYFIYSKLKEDDFIGFRSSGKMLDITPEAMEFICYSGENTHDKDRQEQGITSMISMQSDGDIDIYSKGGDITINSGKNFGMVNIVPLKVFMDLVGTALTSLGHPEVGLALEDIYRELEDKKFKH